MTDDTGIAEVIVGGETVPFDIKGNFDTSIYIPLEGTVVVVEAFDLKGNLTTKTIRLERTKRNQKVNRLAAVNPRVGPKQKPPVTALPSSLASRSTHAHRQQTRIP